MGALQQYRYSIELMYLNIKNGTYNTIYGENVKWMIIDRDYDNYNMPIIYASIVVDKNLADDMIRNYKENLFNISISKHAYDPDDDEWLLSYYDEEYINGQFEYFTDAKANDNDDIDYPDVDDDTKTRKDVYTTITIGFLKVSLINANKRRFNKTLSNTTMTNAISTVTASLDNLVMQPLSYDDILPQIIVPSVDSVSKAIMALNNVKVLYSTPYRFFMDFGATYLLSSDGSSTLRKGQRIADLLVSVKKATDIDGMQEGVYINRQQKNYQINISSTNVSIYDSQISDKLSTDVVAISAGGVTQEASIDIDKCSAIDSKYTTVAIPNDNLNLIENIKAEAETNAVRVSIIKDNIDSSIVDINSLVVFHHLDENYKYNGQYILTRKRELLLNDGQDFTMTLIANYKKLRKVV